MFDICCLLFCERRGGCIYQLYHDRNDIEFVSWRVSSCEHAMLPRPPGNDLQSAKVHKQHSRANFWATLSVRASLSYRVNTTVTKLTAGTVIPTAPRFTTGKPFKSSQSTLSVVCTYRVSLDCRPGASSVKSNREV